MANFRRPIGQVTDYPSLLSTLSRFGRTRAGSIVKNEQFGFSVGAATTATTKCYAASWVDGSTTTPNNALGAPDGTFTTNTALTEWYGQWRMEAPPEALDGRLQTVQVICRTSATGYSYLESLDLYVGGSFVGSGTLTGVNDVLDKRSQTVTFTFPGSLITNTSTFDIGLS